MKTHTKHTSGPWKVETRIKSGEFVRTAHIVTPDGSHLANVGPCNIDANARLIAAAPDLLAALVGMMNKYGDKSAFPTCDASISARAAILKAEGAP